MEIAVPARTGELRVRFEPAQRELLLDELESSRMTLQESVNMSGPSEPVFRASKSEELDVVHRLLIIVREQTIAAESFTLTGPMILMCRVVHGAALYAAELYSTRLEELSPADPESAEALQRAARVTGLWTDALLATNEQLANQA